MTEPSSRQLAETWPHQRYSHYERDVRKVAQA